MDWTTILANAGIPEPPGHDETVAAMGARDGETGDKKKPAPKKAKPNPPKAKPPAKPKPKYAAPTLF